MRPKNYNVGVNNGRFKHGLYKTSEYRAWADFKHRCANSSFKHYGKRGIKVCTRFKDFMEFYRDLGMKPSPKHTVDRIDFNGHYSCGKCDECKRNSWKPNCRWETFKTQLNNRRNNKRIEYKGEIFTITQLAEKLGLKDHQLRGRLKHGWTLEKAISTPIAHKYNRQR